MALGEVLLPQHPDVVAVDRLGLLLVETGRVRVDVDNVERGRELVEREHVAVGTDRPAEQREVVEQPLGDEAAVPVQEQVGLRVALGELLVAGLAQHQGMCAKRGTNVVTPASMSAAYRESWRAVEGMRSSPRSTWVIPIRASSTGFTKVYSGTPFGRTTTKSGNEPAGR